MSILVLLEYIFVIHILCCYHANLSTSCPYASEPANFWSTVEKLCEAKAMTSGHLKGFVFSVEECMSLKQYELETMSRFVCIKRPSKFGKQGMYSLDMWQCLRELGVNDCRLRLTFSRPVARCNAGDWNFRGGRGARRVSLSPNAVRQNSAH